MKAPGKVVLTTLTAVPRVNSSNLKEELMDIIKSFTITLSLRRAESLHLLKFPE